MKLFRVGSIKLSTFNILNLYIILFRDLLVVVELLLLKVAYKVGRNIGYKALLVLDNRNRNIILID